MYAYIKGTIDYLGDGFIVLEANGIGYHIHVSPSTQTLLANSKNTVKVYTYLSVKEDGITLFGFESMDKQELFHKLIGVSGIGPKSAMAIVGEISASDLIMAIVSDDLKTLGKLPGVGKKTAQRLVIELRDKFKNADFLESLGGEMPDPEPDMPANRDKADALEALLALGYSRSEAVKAIAKVYQEDMDSGIILKAALKAMLQ